MDFLTLKSTVSEIYDFRNVDVSDYVPEFEADEKQLERDMRLVLTKYAEKISAETVSQGDTAVISCRSGNSRFRKDRISVIVGRRLFDRELEAKLVGMAVGRSAEISVAGEKVEVTIHSVTRTIMPALSDEAVAGLGIDGVTTVDDLRRSCLDRQIDRLIDENEDADMASAMAAQEVAQKSVFSIDPEEEEAMKAMVRGRLEADGSMSEDLLSMMYPIMLNGFKIAVIGQQIAMREGRLVTMEDYEAMLRGYVDYSAGELTIEQAAHEHPIMEFLINRYAEEHNKAIDAYVAECFKKALNP